LLSEILYLIENKNVLLSTKIHPFFASWRGGLIAEQ
jgi:hypothetical protein